jgi:hypothetical protein
MEGTIFHMPDSPDSDFLTFRTDDAVRFACPDAEDNLLLLPNFPFFGSEVRASCWKGMIYGYF